MYDKKIRYPSANGEHDIYAYLWFPQGNSKARGIIQLIHGMFEYADRYNETAGYFTSKGFIVCGNEHAGHGHSVNVDKNYGYMGSKDGGKTMVRDVHQLFKIMKAEYGKNLPYYIYSHSMGSFIARVYMSAYGKGLNGAVLCGTGQGGRRYLLLSHMNDLAAKLFGEKKTGKLITFGMHELFNLKFKPAETGIEWLSRDEKRLAEIASFELSHFSFTHEGYRDLFWLMYKMEKRKQVERTPKDLPIFLISGSHDPVGNYAKGVIKYYDKLLQLGMKDVTLKIYESARHDLSNETNRDKVLQDVYDWICTRLE